MFTHLAASRPLLGGPHYGFKAEVAVPGSYKFASCVNTILPEEDEP